MSIIIGADIVPTKSNYELFNNAEVEKLIGAELIELLHHADYRIFNLEVPLTDISTPIDKGGHNMRAPTSCIAGLSAIGVNLFTLSNNHILDHGAQGLFSTCAVLDSNKINHVGTGNNLNEAARPFIFNHKQRKIGIYACAEHEFSIATEEFPGANPFDPLESLDHISELKRSCDYVIVLYHGGKELFRYPSPNLQKVCHKLVEKGADLVICQHSHCIGCEERYKESTIIYGQGNFLFDKDNNEFWQTGLLVELTDEYKINYIPIVKYENGVRLASKSQKKQILDAFNIRNHEILLSGFVENNYTKFARRATGYYFLEFKGIWILMFAFRVLNKLSSQKLMGNFSWRKYYKGRHYCAMRNYIECETHRELILNVLKNGSNAVE